MVKYSTRANKKVNDIEENKDVNDDNQKTSYEVFKGRKSKSKITIEKINKKLQRDQLDENTRASSLNDRAISSLNVTQELRENASQTKSTKTFEEISSQTLNDLNNPILSDVNKIFIKDYINKGKKKEFPKKEFIINEIKKKFTAYLNFTISETVIEDQNISIEFKCMFCNVSAFKAKLGETSNIKAHLSRKHNDLLGSWFHAYDNRNNSHGEFVIDNDTFKLFNYFISSNTAHSELNNPFLRDLLPCKIPCAETFSESIIKRVLEMVRDVIQKKLNDATSICLISDIWSNKQMLAFMGLVAVLTNKYFEKNF